MLLAFGTLLATSGPAVAAPVAVTIGGLEPTLEETDDGKTEVPLSLTNLTDQPIELSATPVKPQDECKNPPVNPAQLDPAQSTDVKIELWADCDTADGFAIEVVASSGATVLRTFEVHPEGKPDPKPDWDQLEVFGWGFLLSLIFVLLPFGVWTLGSKEGEKRGLTTPLSSLDATWKFNDNWVTNVTAVGGLLTGVFGSSEVLKAFLGPNSEPSIALATVGAAIALAFVAAGPIVVLATKSRKKDAFTVYGLLLGAAVILTSAFGQLWVVRAGGEELDLGGFEDNVDIFFFVAVALLGLYVWRSLAGLLEAGTAPKPKKPTPPEVRAALMIIKAFKPKPDVDSAAVEADVRQAASAYAADPEEAPSEYEQRQRSVLL